MVDQKPRLDNKGELTEQEVISFLRRNPKVLAHNPDLFTSIQSEARFDSESIVDMQKFVVARLRQQVDDLQASSDDLVSTTRSNMSILEKTHESALALLNAKNFSDLGRVLQEELPLNLGVDATAIAFELSETNPTLPAAADGVVRSLDIGTVDDLIGTGQSTVLRPDVVGDSVLYANVAGLVRSDALVRLTPDPEWPPGIFAVGCRKTAHFKDGQGTEIIGFLAKVALYAVKRWWIRDP